jgi:Flp pilus assembly protein TadG
MTRRKGWAERGAAAVEFAIVLPILLLILGGIIDYGRLFFTEIMLANGARDGVRAAIVAAPADRVAQGQARAAIASASTPGWQGPAAVTVQCGATPATVTVVTSASFRFFFVGILPGVPPTKTLTSSATMGCV